MVDPVWDSSQQKPVGPVVRPSWLGEVVKFYLLIF